MKVTKQEKALIAQIGVHPYSPDFVEEWLERKSENVYVNAPAALQQAMVEGFVEGVRGAMKLMSAESKKCSFPDGIVIKPDGVNELDPCLYKEIERHANVTVAVSECIKCGNVSISWHRQEDTIDLETE